MKQVIVMLHKYNKILIRLLIFMRRLDYDIFGNKSRSTINSKRKGNSNELTVSKWLMWWTRLEFNRVPNSGGLRWKNSEGVVGDLICEDKSFPFVVETKHYKKLVMRGVLRKNSFVYKIYHQCKRDSDRVNKLPMLILRENKMKVGEFIIFFEGWLATFFSKTCPLYSISHEKSKIKLVGYLSSDILKNINFNKFLKELKNSNHE